MMLVWVFAFFTCFCVLSYHRASLNVWMLSIAVFLGLMIRLSYFSVMILVSCGVIFSVIFLMLFVRSCRKKLITAPLLKYYRAVMPSMSRTEKEALDAGTVGWEGDLFRGNPNWQAFLNFPAPQLSFEEKAFLRGPVETLCAMIDDWDITQNRADLPEAMWDFIKTEGFFGLIIPKEYGGKQFSAFAHSQILTKLYGRSTTVASTIAVPNSLGPAELLLHYGTKEQKAYYLPRLARGVEIPCFALTGPDAGSDAGAMKDTGIVCWGEFEGKKILGIRLHFNKRYITLAPVATVIGLAFKLYDPDHLLGAEENLGITCALLPRDTAGISIGRRHFPLNMVFQNGPIHGDNVFIPVDWIIGGIAMAGQGWKMLMECLAAGRAISLPASGIGSAKVLSFASGAYARIRQQFGVPIGRFEGIAEVLARIAGNTYIMDAVRTFTVGMIDAGGKPAVASAITKYHVTEIGRQVANDAMDIHGGKGICLGPRNYLARYYEATPIAITVEGANILTRNMIIFGQGAMRCHPYLLAEFEAAAMQNPIQSLNAFDKALFGHMSFTLSNVVRSFLLALTGGLIVQSPQREMKRYFQNITRFSSAFALVADICLMLLGGNVKRKESISARLGDILSDLYILSAILKHYDDQGKNPEDIILVRWSCLLYLYKLQESFDDLLHNFPSRFLGKILRVIIFPWGKRFTRPSDSLSFQVAELLLSPTASRYRLAEGAYLSPNGNNMIALLEDAFLKTIAAEPIQKMLKSAVHENKIQGETLIDQAKAALTQKILTQEQYNSVFDAEEARQKVIAVDDFTTEELAHAK